MNPHNFLLSRKQGLYLLVYLSFTSTLFPQTPPTQAFKDWARNQIHRITSVDAGSKGITDLQPLDRIVGDAHVIAFGEPIHGSHEPLALRNRLVQYGVSQLGFSAVALETCLSSSKTLYDYVLGRTSASDSNLKEAFCYGFGDYPENIELLHWLRAYNSSQNPGHQVRIYGVDLSGQYFPTAYRSVESVLAYLDHANPKLGSQARSQMGDVISIFRADRYMKLTMEEKDACTRKIQNLISMVERERGPLTDATSIDDYDWALRQATTVAQDDSFLRALPKEFDLSVPRWWQAFKPSIEWEYSAEMREVAIADNILWVEQRECRRGRVFYFAHDEHISSDIGTVGTPSHPPPGQYRQIRLAGEYLRSALATDLVTIGTYFSHASGFSSVEPPEPEVPGMEDLLDSASVPLFIVSLHELPASGPLHDWFQAARGVRASILRDADYTITPLKAFDAVVFIHEITPSPPRR